MKELFFDSYEKQGTKPQFNSQGIRQSKLLVNINSIIVTMQKFVLDSTRKHLKSGLLNKDVFAINFDAYTAEEVLGYDRES